METKVLLMGEYVTLPTQKKPMSLKIPAIETCVSVIIICPNMGVSAAHIDNGFHAITTTNKMVTDIKAKFSPDAKIPTATRAILVGGDYGNPLADTSFIYKGIIKVLERHKIPYQHQHSTSHLKTYLLPAIYLVARGLGYIGPESTLYTGLLFAGITLASIVVEPMLNDQSFSVVINLQTLEETVNQNQRENDIITIKSSRTDSLPFLQQRMALDPQDSKNSAALQLVDVSAKLGAAQ